MSKKLIKKLLTQRLADIPGLAFSSDFIENYRYDPSPFGGLSLNEMPVIDLAGMNNCERLFSNCNINRFRGFENSNDVKNAAFMFENCVTASEFPKFDVQNIVNGSGMFMRARIPNFAGTFEFRSLKNGSNMFNNCEFRDAPFGDSLEFPRLEEAENMFKGSRMGSAKRLNRILMPVCVNAMSTFAGLAWLESIKDITVGGNDARLWSMFETC